MAKLSLAEQISQLANPKPKDVDIENFEDRDDGSESEGDVDYDSDLATEHYVNVGKSKLRDDAPALNPKYKAGKVSRKALYDDDEEDGDGADGFIEEEDDEEEEEDDEEEEGEGNGFIDDEVEVDEDEDDEEDEEMEDEEEQQEDESDEELSENENDSSARATLKELLREEKKAAKQQAKEATVSDAQKGFAIQKQTDLYETLLDARITFQKAVQSANALPISEAKAEELGEEDISNNLQDTKSKLSDFISQIAKMRHNMAVQDNVFGGDAVKLSTKRTFEATVDNMEKLDTEFKAYETSVLTKWSQKVQASSAASALNSSKFKALNQSSANQVAATLADMDRLVKRTRMNRSNVVILGEEQMGAIQDAEGENYYVFDDSDFYRNLLKDLIDRRMVDSASQSSGVKTWTATKAKTKKTVDTRASKGRKLRYHVQDKVQNFAAPRPVFSWEDDQIDELFAGLLGQRVNFNEDDDGEEKKEDAEEDKDEQLVIPDDGLRIFG